MAIPLCLAISLILSLQILRLPKVSSSTVKDFEELHFLKHSQAKFVCPLANEEDGKEEPSEAVTLVVYFRGTDSEKALIFVDNRQGTEPNYNQSGRYQVLLDATSKTSTLVIEDVEEDDEGIYRCRIDYRRGRSTWRRFRMELIIPPSQLHILATSKIGGPSPVPVTNGIAGPYPEGQSFIQLVCNTDEVKPMPAVFWYEGETLLDDSYNELTTEHRPSEDYTGQRSRRHSAPMIRKDMPQSSARRRRLASRPKREATTIKFTYKHGLSSASNALVLKEKLGRKDNGRTFRCVARNTELAPAWSQEVQLAVYLRPINVSIIIGSEEALRVHTNVGLICRSYGSIPRPQIVWMKNRKLIQDGIETHFNHTTNETISSLRFFATIEDNNAEIECLANNTLLPESIGSLHDTIRLRLQHAPQVSIVRVYSPKDPFPTELTAWPSQLRDQPLTTSFDVLEKDRLTLLCFIRANPPISGRASWYFNGQDLNYTIAKALAIGLSNDTLTIDHLDHQMHTGLYSCSAENDVGFNTSQAIQISVGYVPKCLFTNSTYLVGRGEEVEVNCDVDAYPPAVNYRWLLDDSTIAKNLYETSSRTIFYRPTAAHEFGRLTCIASNAAGTMVTSCAYQIVPYGRPDPVQSCSVAERTDDAELLQSSVATVPAELLFNLDCQFAYNGGIETYCTAEIYRNNDSVLVWSGASPPARLLPDADAYICSFRPSILLQSKKKYRFFVTSVNDAGHAKRQYKLIASVRYVTSRRRNTAQYGLGSGRGNSISTVSYQGDDGGNFPPNAIFVSTLLVFAFGMFIIWITGLKQKKTKERAALRNAEQREAHQAILALASVGVPVAFPTLGNFGATLAGPLVATGQDSVPTPPPPPKGRIPNYDSEEVLVVLQQPGDVDIPTPPPPPRRQIPLNDRLAYSLGDPYSSRGSVHFSELSYDDNAAGGQQQHQQHQEANNDCCCFSCCRSLPWQSVWKWIKRLCCIQPSEESSSEEVNSVPHYERHHEATQCSVSPMEASVQWSSSGVSGLSTRPSEEEVSDFTRGEFAAAAQNGDEYISDEPSCYVPEVNYPLTPMSEHVPTSCPVHNAAAAASSQQHSCSSASGNTLADVHSEGDSFDLQSPSPDQQQQQQQFSRSSSPVRYLNPTPTMRYTHLFDGYHPGDAIEMSCTGNGHLPQQRSATRVKLPAGELEKPEKESAKKLRPSSPHCKGKFNVRHTTFTEEENRALAKALAEGHMDHLGRSEETSFVTPTVD